MLPSIWSNWNIICVIHCDNYSTHPTISKERSKEKKDFPWVKAKNL